MESYKSPFARLLEDNDALKYWNDFIERSEVEQSEIIRSISEEYDLITADNNTTQPEKPGRISARIRRTIKIRKNLSLEIVKNSEDELIAFFKATPGDIYIKYPPTSFERLLIHGIAQYHRLKSVSEYFSYKKFAYITVCMYILNYINGKRTHVSLIDINFALIESLCINPQITNIVFNSSCMYCRGDSRLGGNDQCFDLFVPKFHIWVITQF